MRRAHWRDVEATSHVGDLPLFALVRRTDPPTSTLAAEAVADRLSGLQTAVLEAFRRHGPMTAKQAEQLPEFGHLGPSTVRKRICECARLGELEPTGAIVDRCAVYAIPREYISHDLKETVA